MTVSFLDKLRFKVWDSVGVVISKLEAWRPRACQTEKNFERSLYKYLHLHAR